MPQCIIGLVGQAGSGKGTVAKLLEEKYGAKTFRFSAILGDILKRLSIDASRANLIKVSEVLRGGFGEDALAYAMEQDALTCNSPLVVVDGIRRLEDIAGLEPLPIFHLVEVAVPAEVRFERIRQRKEKVGETGLMWEQFCETEKASTEVTIPTVAARAWRSVQNVGTPEDLERLVADIMAEVAIKPL